MNIKKNVAICIGDKKSYSETFIKAHIEHLGAKLIYKSMLPYVDGGNLSGNVGLKSKLNEFYAAIINKRKTSAIKKFLIQNNIGVVLAEYGHMGVAVLETCKKNNIPLVVYFYGFEAYKHEILQKYSNDYKRVFEYASALVVVSNHMKEQLINLGAKAEKVHHVVCGADMNKFTACDVLNSQRKILFIGRFVEKKAPYLTILAFKKVLETVPDARLYLVGDGLLLDVCVTLVRSLHLNDNVSFLGVKKHEELIALMKQSRMYVQHSMVPASGDSEGTPVAIVEAQAAGLPVVSTFHAGIQEVVIHKETGFLVEEGNIDAMAKYMCELLLDPQLASKMGLAGRENVMRNYTLIEGLDRLKSILYQSMNAAY